MKLIIDIPENLYKATINGLSAGEIWDLRVIINDGTPLEESEDCVSRQAVLSMQYRIDDSATLSTRDVVNVNDIEDLLPVNPAEKIGKWIYRDEESDWNNNIYECSCCSRKIKVPYNLENIIQDYPYCNCGAKMQEVEE